MNPIEGTPRDNKQKRRRTKREVEVLRKQIYQMRMRGMTKTAIAKACGVTEGSVRYHLKEYAKDAFKFEADSTKAEKVGEMLRHLQGLFNEAMFQMTKMKESHHKHAWFESAAKRLQELIKFKQLTGLLPMESHKLDVTVKDVRSLSNQELLAHLEAMQREIGDYQLIETVPTGHGERQPITLDSTSKVEA